MNLLDTFHARVAEHPGRTATIGPKDQIVTYADIEARAARLAAAWQAKGLRAGDRVLLLLGFSPDLYIGLAALWRLGAVAVLPEPALGIKGVKTAIESAQPSAVLLGGIYRLLPLFVPAVRRITTRLGMKLTMKASDHAAPPVADLPADAPALISFTTGSTGKPKAIVRSHGFMQAQERAVAPLIGTHRRHEIDLVGFPVFVVANLGQGITSVLPDWSLRRTDKVQGAAIARRIDQHGVTRLLLNPALVERLIEVSGGLAPSVHSIFTGGGPVFPDVLAQSRTDFPHIRMVAVYGSTEAEPIAELDTAEIRQQDFETMVSGGGILAGHPVDAVRMRIVDDEIQVAGDHVVQGYLDPARDGETKIRDTDGTLWHRTGDAGRIDDEGRLWLLGRLNGKVAGHFPFSVEGAARSWPGVVRAALASRSGCALLVIEGNAVHEAAWRDGANAMGIKEIILVERIPTDRRHGSKIDTVALAKLLGE